MAQSTLSSFEVHGFRAFDHLKIERLERVNLLVGKNNVGKTALLEALWIYANQGSPSVLWSLLEGRDESRPMPQTRRIADESSGYQSQFSSIRYLFYGRKQPNADLQPMEFGSLEVPGQHVSIKFTWVENIIDEQGNQRIHEVKQADESLDTIPALAIQTGKNNSLIRFDRLAARIFREQFSGQMEKPCIFLPANGLSIHDIGEYWDNITLGPSERDVLEVMKIIDPEIERINLISDQKTTRPQERIPIVKISSFDDPIPLKNLGEGMNRMFGIALTMVNAKGGILLVDEIENGLHYSILPEMWRFIFRSAQRLNLQIFATTHSWDCISGFQQAAQESEQDGLLIRLTNKRGKIIPTYYDEQDLVIATREQIEVR